MRQENRVAFDICLIVIGFIFVGCRLYIRYYVRRLAEKTPCYYLNDGFLLFALAIASSFAGQDASLQLGEAQIRDGLMTIPQQRAWATHSLKSAFYFYLAYTISAWSIKASFLMNYYNASHGLSRHLFFSLIFATILVFATFLTVIFSLLFICHPVSRYWAMDATNCLVTVHHHYAEVVFSCHLISDLAVMIMGITVIRKTFVMRGHREYIAIGIICGIAVTTMVAAAVRFGGQWEMNKKMKKGTLLTSKQGDRVKEYVVIAAIAELFLAVVVACLPAFRIWLRTGRQKDGSGEDGSPKAGSNGVRAKMIGESKLSELAGETSTTESRVSTVGTVELEEMGNGDRRGPGVSRESLESEMEEFERVRMEIDRAQWGQALAPPLAYGRREMRYN